MDGCFSIKVLPKKAMRDTDLEVVDISDDDDDDDIDDHDHHEDNNDSQCDNETSIDTVTDTSSESEIKNEFVGFASKEKEIKDFDSITKVKIGTDKKAVYYRLRSWLNRGLSRRPWLNIFVCFVINFCIQTIESFVDMAIHDQSLLNVLAMNAKEAQYVNNYFKSMIDFYAPVGVFLMTRFGHRVNGIAGSLIVCVSFTGISFLDSTLRLGISLLKIGALVPVLELFTKQRMEALLLTKVGFVLGSFIDISVKFAGNLDWKTLYRINAGLCTLPVVFICIMQDISIQESKEKENTEAKKNPKNDDCNVPCPNIVSVKFPVLKKKKLWTVFGVFSTFRFGNALPRFSKWKIPKQIKGQIQSTTDSFVEDLTVIIGTLAGIILSFLFKKCSCLDSYRKRGLVFAFTIVSFASPVLGFSSAVTFDKVGYYVFFNLVLIALKVLSENIRTESMPDVLGRSNIRITEGLVHMFNGLGGILAATVQHWLRSTDEEQDWKSGFKIGGGSLLVTGLVSQAYVIYGIINEPDPRKKHPNKPRKLKISEEETSDATFENENNNAKTGFTEAGTSNIEDSQTTIVQMPKVPRSIPGPPTPPQSTSPPPLGPSNNVFPIDCPKYAASLLPPYKRIFPKKNSERFQ